MIKIGISSCFMYPDKERTVFGHKSLSYLENDMARYLTRKGVLPVLIPDVADELLEDILIEMDGFVFQGGVDLAPETYGEKPIGKWKGDAYRDQYELKIMDYAVKNSKPVFAICRGMQLMNVYFGGTLYQDTITQNPNAENHRSAELYDTIRHPIDFVEGTLLDKLYNGVENPHVNTVHHQAVKDLGNDLEVYATSPDGLIEAFGYIKEPEGKVFGVQWHPEFSPTLGAAVINEDLLYEAFLKHTR
ncbi:gamma-glutamyl-gamma-aminobutyrate hydrolase family protein [Maribacter halichondriae]|uniref:gamma-glutamyl-gamma-aminobutyrate hydrolase family protein n=1 Tax=Maribacter halichondriae TaxID=2980554 RepID=UPI002358DA2E|nr:gamma-glutamyl-gamma-aminobutyrate hydrolase family protein [Maribacter sp. Hal144]